MAKDFSPPTALTIAGSDSGGAAGLQADLRTFLACGVHGLVAVTAVTVQNTLGVHDRTDIPPHIVAGQIEAVAADMGVNAAKTGMLASAEIIKAVAEACDKANIGRDLTVPFVVDPVAASVYPRLLRTRPRWSPAHDSADGAPTDYLFVRLIAPWKTTTRPLSPSA